MKLNEGLWRASVDNALMPSFLPILSDSVNSSEDKNPIRINPPPQDSRGSNQVSLSDWTLVVGKGEEVFRKVYKTLRHQGRDSETSPSGVTAWALHQIWGLSTLRTSSELVNYWLQLRTPSSYPWVGLEWWHSTQDGSKSLSFQINRFKALVLPINLVLP